MRRLRVALPILLLLFATAASPRAARRRAPAARPTVTAPAAAPAPPTPAPLPPIVFVSRKPIAGEDTAVPGMGPHHRAVATGGRLLVREPDGRLRELVPAASFFDVADPAPSLDGRRVAFAATTHADSAWRLWVVGVDGRGLAPLTRGDRTVSLAPLGASAARLARYDDLDPCWISDHWLVFASTRFPQIAQYGDVPVTNLYLVRDTGALPVRLTTERNGAEEPALDPVTGRLVYARWWYNRHRPSDRDASGITTESALALPGDSANFWQAVSVTPGGSDVRLAAGDPRARRVSTAYQPAPLEDGTLAGVVGTHLAFSPRPGGAGVQIFGLDPEAGHGGLPRAIGPPLRLIGAAVGDQPTDPYHEGRGLAPPSACAPAGLPGGRLVIAYDPGARGDYGLWTLDENGEHLEPLVDLPGTLELDPAPIVERHPRLLVDDTGLAAVAARGAMPLPVADTAEVRRQVPQGGFTFHCLNLFTTGPLDAPMPGPPPLGTGLVMRFFASLARPDLAGGDTAIRVREVAIGPQGEIVAAGLVPDVPMFEQVATAEGRVLFSAHGAAHVAGLNASAVTERRCVGCHAGHSVLRVPDDPEEARWFDASPSAAVTSSGDAEGSTARAVVDLRTRGPDTQVAWIPSPSGAPWVRLAWPRPIVVREVAVHVARAGGAIQACDVRLLRGGVEVARESVTEGLDPEGTHVGFKEVEADALELTILRTSGRPHAGIAEIETIARLP